MLRLLPISIILLLISSAVVGMSLSSVMRTPMSAPNIVIALVLVVQKLVWGQFYLQAAPSAKDPQKAAAGQEEEKVMAVNKAA